MDAISEKNALSNPYHRQFTKLLSFPSCYLVCITQTPEAPPEIRLACTLGHVNINLSQALISLAAI